jgi:hypothetical protein
MPHGLDTATPVSGCREHRSLPWLTMEGRVHLKKPSHCFGCYRLDIRTHLADQLLRLQEIIFEVAMNHSRRMHVFREGTCR